MSAALAFLLGLFIGAVLLLFAVLIIGVRMLTCSACDEGDDRDSAMMGVVLYGYVTAVTTVMCLIFVIIGPIEAALFFFLPLAGLAARLTVLDYRRLDALTPRAKAAILAEGGHTPIIAEAA